MRVLSSLVVTSAILAGACAAVQVNPALSRITSAYVIARPLKEAWPLATETLARRSIVAFPAGEGYRLATAIVSAEGQLPPTAPQSKAGSAAGAQTAGSPEGGERGGGGRGGRGGGGHAGAMRMGAPGVPRGKLVRYVVEGVALDATHCQVHFIRFDRDALDEPESPGQRDPELEWQLISMAEPVRTAELRGQLTDAGVALP